MVATFFGPFRNSRPKWGSLIDVTVKTLFGHLGSRTGYECAVCYLILSASDHDMMLHASRVAKVRRLYWCGANYVRWILRSHDPDLYLVKHARVLYKGFELEDAMLSSSKVIGNAIWIVPLSETTNLGPPLLRCSLLLCSNKKMRFTFRLCQLGVEFLFADILKGTW